MTIKSGKNNQGVTLLLSLVIMSTVVSVAIGLSVLIINQLEFSTNIDKALTAYYAAESGIEKNLRVVRLNREIGNLTSVINGIKSDTGTLPTNRAQWNMSESTDSEGYLIAFLPENQRVTFDLPDGVESAKINWSDSCPETTWMELGALKVTASGLSTDDPYRQLIPCLSSGSLVCDPQTVNVFEASNPYIVTLRPIYCDVTRLTFYAYTGPDATGSKKNIANRVYLKSVGSYQTSQVSISASVPWRIPPQAIFDFVLFSEESISKD